MGLDAYGPVSGNWCWISSERASLRYALTHSWRMAIFLATFVIYTYIYIHLKRTFNRFALSTTPTTNHNIPGEHQHQVGGKANDSLDTTDTSEIIVKKTFYIDTGDHSPAAAAANPVSFASATHGEVGMPLQDLESARTSNGAALARPLKADANDRHVHGGARHASRNNLRRMLLLNGYPVLYIVLWIPGIATRLTEAVRGSSPTWLLVMQSSTQYIGLANAVTYSWNEKMTDRFKRLLS